MQSRSEKWTKFLKARLSPEEFLGLHLTVGVLLLTAATWVFAAVAEDVATGEALTVIDVRFSNWLHAHATSSLTVVMLLITNLHSTWGIIIMSLAVSVYLLIRWERHWVFTLLLTVCGGMMLNVLLKNVFHRARPHFDDPILTLTSYGFPSGHTMMATVFYGTLCAFVITHVRGWYWRALAVIVAIFLIALVGFSRIYLGVHYLSDVLGAMAEGSAWLALCLTATETMRRRHLRNKSKYAHT